MANAEITDADLARTAIELAYQFDPLQNIICDLGSILAGSAREVIRAFYPRQVAQRAYIAISELVNNVLENVVEPDSGLTFRLMLEETLLTIQITNAVTIEQFEAVSQHLEKINTATNLRGLLKETIHARRAQRLKGGLGLIRLALENKFQLAASFDSGLMTIDARLALGGPQ